MNRTALINYLIRQRTATRYLEIGVGDEQHNFAHIDCAHKVGVDPNPVTTFQGTSDSFFATNREQFDVIFIDGLHTEEQVLRDVRNAGECLAQGGVIVLHDCMPPDAWHQREEPEHLPYGENWNGTVWKAALRLFNETTHRCDLVDTDWGCGVIDTSRTQVPARRDLPGELNYKRHYALLLEHSVSVPMYLRERVRVFYHLACLQGWRGIFDEQMRQLQRSGFCELDLTVLGSQSDLRTATGVCAESGIGANLVFHAEDMNHFERPALLAIEDYARQNDAQVLYLHSKGVSDSANVIKTRWRQLMMRELVEKWQDCVVQLPYYDIIGVNWREMPPISHFCGNFWYASTVYLRTLADFAHYYEYPRYRIWDAINDRRLGCEFWISSSSRQPRVLSLVCRNIDFCGADFWTTEQVG